MKQNVMSVLCFLILLALLSVALAERKPDFSSQSLKNFFSVLLNREKSKKSLPSTALSSPQVRTINTTTPLSCEYIFKNYHIFPGVSYGLLNVSFTKWWNQHYCNINYVTCARVKSKYGIIGSSWQNSTVPHLRIWWEASNCSLPSTAPNITTCCSVREKYNVDPFNRSWGSLTDATLRKWWNDHNCNISVTLTHKPTCGYYLNQIGLKPSAEVFCDQAVALYYKRFKCNSTSLNCFAIKVNHAILTSNNAVVNWGSMKNTDVINWYMRNNCSSLPDETCKTLRTKFGVISQSAWGTLMDQGTKNWWKMVNCGVAFEPIPWENLTCAYIAENFKVVPNFSWGAVSDPELRSWWNNNCNNYYSCFGLKLKYGIVPNFSWGSLLNPYVKYWWNNMTCDDQPDESCFTLLRKHGIVPNQSWGNLMELSVRKWWTDNDCATAVANPSGSIPTPAPFTYDEKSLQLAPPTPPCLRFTPTAPCHNATCGNGSRGNGLCSDGRCCNATGYCGKTTSDCKGIVRPSAFLYPPPPKCPYLFPRPFNASLLLRWAKSYKTYWCALQYIMAQPELKNVTQPDPYQFPIAAFDALRGQNNSKLYNVAKVMYGLRPTTCFFPDEDEDLCNIWEDYVIPAPQQVVFPPVCTRTLCWFHPGSECTVYLPHWYWLETWKYDQIRKNTSFSEMKKYLSNCSRVNCATRDPVNPIITQCKSMDEIQDVPCPLYNCNNHGATTRNVPEKRKKNFRLLTMIQKRSKRLHTRLLPMICGTTFSCEDCQNSDQTALDQQCYGQKWGSSDALCCVCAIAQSSWDSTAWF